MDIFLVLAQTVVFLFASPTVASSPVPIGTGFVIQYPISQDKTKFIPLIITAKHVIGDFEKIYARFNTPDGSQTALVEYNVLEQKKTNDYWEHSDEGVDICVFRTLHFSQTKYEALPIDFIADRLEFEANDIKQTDRVVFPGLLVNFMGKKNNYPIMKDGSIALIPNEKVPMSYKVGPREITTQQDLIFLNSISIPGLSGAPVFLWPGPRLVKNAFSIGGSKPILLGVMHGFYPALPREGIKVETTEARWLFQENTGIAIVFPSWRLKEILTQDNFVKRMNELKTQVK